MLAHNEFAQVFVDNTEKLQQMAELVSRGFDNAKANEAEYGSRESETIKFSRMNRDTFEKNVKSVLEMSDDFAIKTKQEANYVSVMRNTPDVILKHVENAKGLETIISFHSLYLAARKDGALKGHYHNLGKKVIDLPRYMSNPDTILLMDNGRLNLISEIDYEKKNGVISIELNTVKDINNKYNAYNLVISVFSGKNNYIRNNISKHAVAVKYKKDDLSQVNPQLYEWLAIINDKSSFGNNISQSSPKSNTKSEIRGKKSKDDTIYDNDFEERLLWSEDEREDGTGEIDADWLNPENGSAQNREKRKKINVRELLSRQTPDEAVYNLHESIARRSVATIRNAAVAAELEKTDAAAIAGRAQQCPAGAFYPAVDERMG